MKKQLLVLIAISFLFVAFLPAKGQVTMSLYITDNGPTPQSGEYYYLVIDVVQVSNGTIITHFTPYYPTWSNPVSTTNNPWLIDVSCSDGPTPDVDSKVFRVDYTMYRDTNPPFAPPIARGSGSSDLLNSDEFYNGFDAYVTLN
jgi:hypothetical protein